MRDGPTLIRIGWTARGATASDDIDGGLVPSHGQTKHNTACNRQSANLPER